MEQNFETHSTPPRSARSISIHILFFFVENYPFLPIYIFSVENFPSPPISVNFAKPVILFSFHTVRKEQVQQVFYIHFDIFAPLPTPPQNLSRKNIHTHPKPTPYPYSYGFPPETHSISIFARVIHSTKGSTGNQCRYTLV